MLYCNCRQKQYRWRLSYGPPKKNVVRLLDADVKRLKSIIRKKDTSQTTANQCRILLALDEAHPSCRTYDMCIAAFGVS